MAFVLGAIFGIFCFALMELISLKLHPPTRLGMIQFKIMAFMCRVLGLEAVMNPKYRALRCFELAAKLAVAAEVPVNAANTILALQYSEPPEPLEKVLGELAVATVLAAHTKGISLSEQIVKKVQSME